jgi:hypothetical protein
MSEQPAAMVVHRKGRCPCGDCAEARTVTISPLGTVSLGQAVTGHDRLIKKLQRRNSRGKARRRGGRRG